MAIVTPGDREREQREMADAFGEDVPPPGQVSDDEAFGLTPPDQASGETPDSDTASVSVENPEEQAPAEGGEEQPAQPELPPEEPTGGEEAPVEGGEAAAPAQEAGGSVDWEQKYKTLEGKYKAEIPAMAAKVRDLEAQLAEEEAESPAEESQEQVSGEESAEHSGEEMPPSDMLDSPEKAMAWATENFGPEFVKVIDMLVDAKLKGGIGEVDGRLSSLMQRIEDRDVRDHFRDISRAHPDFVAVIKTPEFESWRTSHPEAERMAQVFDSGSSDEVIEMLNAFKDGAEQTPGTIADDSADGVRSSGAGLRLPEEVAGMAEDYLDAFEEFAAQDK
ncbi:MAG: hypothetical protein LCH90_24045 [Proteobacteria bacterium]|nr:hypothetical protein [Pseudomonadota bacterium]